MEGLILNSRNIEREQEIVEQFAEEIGTKVQKIIPRDALIQSAEDMQKTVVEAYPDSQISREYDSLADLVLKICREKEQKDE